MTRTRSTTDPSHAIEDKTQRAVQSVEAGGRLLLALASSDVPLGLGELAAKAQMTASRAHTYLVSYARLGLIEQNTSGRYDLGPGALKIGLACLRRLEPLQAAEPVMRNLADRTGHAVVLSVWGNLGPTVVRMVEARQPLHVTVRVGSVLSVMDTATGRAFAAYLPVDKLKQGVGGPLGDFLSPEVGETRLADLHEVQREARAHGVNRSLGSPIPGVNAYGAPAFDFEGNPILVLSITDHQNRLPGAWDAPAVKLLKDAAQNITDRLGGVHSRIDGEF